MATAPKVAASLKDPEEGGPSVFVPRGKTPPPEPIAVSVSSSKSAEEEARSVLTKAFGPISPSIKNVKPGTGGRKHRTRKHKKSVRKTKKHLRRK